MSIKVGPNQVVKSRRSHGGLKAILSSPDLPLYFPFSAFAGAVAFRSLPFPVVSETPRKCRDRATTTYNLLDFNGTDSPFLIL